MRIALINPPLFERYVNSIDEPLGILYLAASLQNNHEVYLIDSFNNLLSTEETIEIIKELNVEVLGVSMIFTGAYQTSLEIIKTLKQIKPSITSIIGGNTATFLVNELAGVPFIDYVVRGEGDISFPRLINALSNGTETANIPGLSFYKDGTIVHNPTAPLVENLDSLPYPARELLPLKYKYPRAILSSRGCAYNCIYCSSSAFWQKTFRIRSIDNIINEIKLLNEQEELQYFSFADDCLTLIPDRAREIATRIHALNLDCTWGCTGRIETMSETLIKDLSDSGCKGIFFGVESGSSRVLKLLKRRYSPNDVYTLYRLCLKHGITPYFSFIIGLPFEEKGDLDQTFNLIQKLQGVENGIHILTPLPGTPIFKEANKYGIKMTSCDITDLDINGKPLITTRHLTSAEISEAYRKAVGYSLKALRKRGVQ